MTGKPTWASGMTDFRMYGYSHLGFWLTTLPKMTVMDATQREVTGRNETEHDGTGWDGTQRGKTQECPPKSVLLMFTFAFKTQALV